jgi:hypothetical protein
VHCWFLCDTIYLTSSIFFICFEQMNRPDIILIVCRHVYDILPYTLSNCAKDIFIYIL